MFSPEDGGLLIEATLYVSFQLDLAVPKENAVPAIVALYPTVYL